MLSTLLFPSVEQASSEAPSVTARDLVSSTSSEDVKSPVMGNDKKKSNRGLSSLLVPSENVYKGVN